MYLLGGKKSFKQKKQKVSTIRIAYVLAPIRTQILPLFLLYIIGIGRCTTALSCLSVKWIGLVGDLREAHPFTLYPRPRAGLGGGIEIGL